ncbi:MAG: tripartite tricarboxylate transporter permease [Rhodospirillaceae bacterium]|nr:tripartite tricarboxylate transporter permease [Rhodospirillaceae bacterium]
MLEIAAAAVILIGYALLLPELGFLISTVIGALPGLGPSNGVAFLIPLAFTLGLPAVPALILLTSVYCGAMYGGRISSILLNIPGDEPAMMPTLDGYPMVRNGQAGEALGISGIASFIGSFFATLGGAASRNQAKAAFAAGLGLAIAMIGVDGQTGVPRLTFGEVHLYDGIDFLVAIVGLFALSEVFIFLEHRGEGDAGGAGAKIKLGRIVPPFSMIRQTFWTMMRSTGLGFIAGVLPGAGASLGSFMAYSLEKKLVDKNKTFGKGDPRGVAAPEAGNNAAAGVAMISFVGIYGISGSTFDLLVMVAFGLMVWVLRKFEVPLVPVILGVLLGNQMEVNLRRELTISNGDWFALVDSPLSIILWLMAIGGFVLPTLIGKYLRPRIKHTAALEAADPD